MATGPAFKRDATAGEVLVGRVADKRCGRCAMPVGGTDAARGGFSHRFCEDCKKILERERTARARAAAKTAQASQPGLEGM